MKYYGSPNGAHDPANGETEGAPSKKSLLIYFAVGAVLLVTPLVLVFAWAPDPSCPSAAEARTNLCRGSPEVYNRTISFLPFVMVAGGAIIAFNMKRLSDANRILPSEEEE
jgi:hypothetical protein